MQAVPAWSRRLDQVRAGQHVQRPAGLRHARAGQSRGGVRFEVGAGVQAEQPEGAGGTGVKVAVGPGEHDPHLGAGILAGLQQVQPGAQVSQLADQNGQRHARADSGKLSRDPQRQRQPAALPGQLSGRARVRGGPRPDQRAKQANRVLQREHVQVQARDAIAGDQPGQRIPAGHHHRTGSGAGQQRPYLPG